MHYLYYHPLLEETRAQSRFCCAASIDSMLSGQWFKSLLRYVSMALVSKLRIFVNVQLQYPLLTMKEDIVMKLTR